MDIETSSSLITKKMDDMILAWDDDWDDDWEEDYGSVTGVGVLNGP
jgi:hypothetical protein